MRMYPVLPAGRKYNRKRGAKKSESLDDIDDKDMEM